MSYNFKSGRQQLSNHEKALVKVVNFYREGMGKEPLMVDEFISTCCLFRTRAMNFDGKITKRGYSKIKNDLIKKGATEVVEITAIGEELGRMMAGVRRDERELYQDWEYIGIKINRTSRGKNILCIILVK